MPLRGQPAPGTPAPNPWDLLRLWVPEPETWGPRASRRDVAPREPPEPTAEQLARLTNGQLRTLLEAAASSLSTDLDRLKTGDNWKKYLELAKLQQEFSDDARQQLDRAVADGMKFGDLTVAEGIKRGDLTIVAGVKLGDLSVAKGMKFGDLTVADGTKLGDLTVAEGMKRGDLTLAKGVKLGDLQVALGVKPGDLTVAEAIKRGNLTVALGVKRGDLTVAEGIKRGNLTVALGFKDAALTDAERLSGKLPDPTDGEEEKRAGADFPGKAERLSGEHPDPTGAEGAKRAGTDFPGKQQRLSSERPDPHSRELLAKIADRFKEVAENPEYKKIAAVRGFQTLRRGLREYLLPATERQAHVLSASLPVLISTLDRQRTGAGWKAFLKLDDLERLLDSENEWQPAELDRLVEILGQFEKIRLDPKYAAVARMPGFKATYEALKALVETLEEERVGSLPPPPQ